MRNRVLLGKIVLAVVNQTTAPSPEMGRGSSLPSKRTVHSRSIEPGRTEAIAEGESRGWDRNHES